MAAPSVENESTTITLIVKEWAEGQTEQFSPVHRINGYPFRLRLGRTENSECMPISIICDKSNEAELWKCNLIVNCIPRGPLQYLRVLCSWQSSSFEFGSCGPHKSQYQVTITTEQDGNSWRTRPPLDSIKAPDGILVIGENHIPVNKEFLASLSPYFDRLFFGNFKEKNMDEIPIGDVEYEEFFDLINIVYGRKESLNNNNVLGVLELADRFELKIVEDSAISFLLSESCSLSLALKLFISQENNIPFLKIQSLAGCSSLRKMSDIKRSYFFAKFSDATKLDILDRMFELAKKCPIDVNDY